MLNLVLNLLCVMAFLYFFVLLGLNSFKTSEKDQSAVTVLLVAVQMQGFLVLRIFRYFYWKTSQKDCIRHETRSSCYTDQRSCASTSFGSFGGPGPVRNPALEKMGECLSQIY